jgi:hypothetical protein
MKKPVFFHLYEKGSIYIGEREHNFAEKVLTYFGLLSLISVFLPKVERVSMFEFMI